MTTQSLPATTDLGYVHLTVADLPRALAFYQERLGLQLHGRSGATAFLGAGGSDLLRLTEVPGARPMPGHSGLYHFALLLPSRADLGAALGHLVRTQTRLTGGADHLVSEALYLSDPDGNGIELYRDRSRSEWQTVDGHLRMDTLPLDYTSLLEAAGSKAGNEQLPVGTVLGHMHLHVGDLDSAVAFYQDVIGLNLQMRYGPSAAFLSSGGYHHHLGVNTWAGVGAPPAPPDATGLRLWQLRVPDEEALEAVRERLEAAHAGMMSHEIGTFVRDPSQNGLLISVRQGEAAGRGDAASAASV